MSGSLALLATTNTTSSGSWDFILIILVVYVAIYFLFIRPRQKKARDARQGNRQVEVGDLVVTTSGLIATVVELNAQTVTLRTSDGTDLEFVRQAIAQKYQEPATPEPETDAHPTEPESGGDSH
jgi:preprotein translocase subunit YajC